ncbi:hypothetical protein SBOR_0797 [Sclerotinia borealis F-4128]|uniref:Uncharacterized protein n=1 Tax=Sclerotinia borealis (strain F-4128) TaxID=1432307 RepID=W9CRX5_SCLBF|nr:hypothetical protein SBOR_0797 [Sclerotinia borealis F-4128]
MLLTIKQPVHHGYKYFHDYSPPTPPASCRFPPAVPTTSSSISFIPATSQSLPPLALTKSANMSTSHRGLPPMTLPQPPQQVVPASLNQPTSSLQLPAPPQQWQGAEESMRSWLQAKAEEDKRKQEEEKTRQEALRLEQRKIEQDMLRTSLAGGIPPYMIPMIFAGMGGGNLPNASLEWAQHYMAQAHQLQQQQQQQVHQQLVPGQSQHTSPEQMQRRDSRPAFGGQHPVPVTLPSTPIGPTGSVFLPSYQMSPGSRSRQIAGSLARATANSQLPELNTGELLIQPPPAASSMHVLPGQSGHPLAQSQSAQQQQEAQSSPSIYFHHWQPPTSQADHVSSPKKRKATGPQQPAPPPTSRPQYTSPSFSQAGYSISGTPSSRRRGHSRNRSDLSARGVDSHGRPSSRHRHTESGFSNKSLPSPAHSQIQEQGSAPVETRRHSGGSNTVSSLLEHSDSRPRAHSQTQNQQSQFQRDRERHYSVVSEIVREERATEGEEARRSNKRNDGRN